MNDNEFESFLHVNCYFRFMSCNQLEHKAKLSYSKALFSLMVQMGCAKRSTLNQDGDFSKRSYGESVLSQLPLNVMVRLFQRKIVKNIFS